MRRNSASKILPWATGPNEATPLKQKVREFLAACVLSPIAWVLPALATAAEPAFEIQVLRTEAPEPDADALVSGSFDSQFQPVASDKTPAGNERLWLKLTPLHDFKPGAIMLSQITGKPILPVAVAATRAIRFRTWDAFELPLPFSRIAIVYGEPVKVGRATDTAALEQWQAKMAESLLSLRRQAEDALERR